MREIWHSVQGYEGLYEVSNIGNVKSIRRSGAKGGALKPNKRNNGYLYVNLYKNDSPQKHNIHRLVAIAFLPNNNQLDQVNHKNGIKTDNKVENLEWCTHKENIQHAYDTNLLTPPHQKKVICIETGVIFKSVTEAGRVTGIDHRKISTCCNGKRKRTHGFTWKFA